MYAGQIVFSQVMQHLPMRRFAACVGHYNGNRRVRTFSCRDQFYAMAFHYCPVKSFWHCRKRRNGKPLHHNMTVFDFNLVRRFGHGPSISHWKERADECWHN